MRRPITLIMVSLVNLLAIGQFPAGQTPPSGWEHVHMRSTLLPHNATPSIAAKALRGTVVIVSVGNEYGTGFWLDETHVATCYHVVGEAPRASIVVVDNDIGSIDPEDHASRGSDMKEGEIGIVIALDRKHDIAILASDTNPFLRNPRIGAISIGGKAAVPDLAIPTIRPDELEDGEEVWLVGYPAGVQHPITQHGTSSYLQRHLVDPSIGLDSPAYVLDQISNPGDSGGPVFDSRGAVAGLLRGAPLLGAQGAIGIRPAEGISHAIPSRFLVELASAHGISLKLSSPAHTANAPAKRH